MPNFTAIHQILVKTMDVLREQHLASLLYLSGIVSLSQGTPLYYEFLNPELCKTVPERRKAIMYVM